MIVVIDSSVWISALQFEGAPLLTIERIVAQHRVAICEQIVGEIRNVLMRKFGWSSDEVEEAFAFYCLKAIHIEVQGSVRGICRDPNDDMVLECAIVAGAELIIADDKDLLALGAYEGIRVLSPRAFLDQYSRPQNT